MAKQQPSGIKTFVVAENVRTEAHGKGTILGVFAGGIIVVPKTSIFPVNFPLAFYVVFSDGEGVFDTKLDLSDPTGKPLGTTFPMGLQTMEPTKSLQLLINFPLISLPVAGRYEVAITLDNRKYRDSFTVRTGDAPGFPIG